MEAEGTTDTAPDVTTGQKSKGKRVKSAATVDEDDDEEVEEVLRPAAKLDKGKGKMVEQDDGESAGEEYHAPTAEVETLDGLCGRALFSYARMNIIKPPAEIVFGEWNARDAVEHKANTLAKSITEQKFRPHASDSLLPLIIEEKYINPTSIHRTPNVEEAPMLTLTAEALEQGIKLQFGGGRHRRRATEIIIETSQEKVKKYSDELEELRGREENVKEGSALADTLAKKIRTREAQIVMEKDVIEKMQVWGVAIYKAGEYPTKTLKEYYAD
jgi:hypothetical protein